MTLRRATVPVLLLLAACGGRSSSTHVGPGGTSGGDGNGGNGASRPPDDAAVNDAPDGAAAGGAAWEMGGSNGSIGGLSGTGGVAGTGSGTGGVAGNSALAGGFGGTLPIGGSGGSLDPRGTLLLPAGCEPRAQMETEESCMLSAFCDSLPHVTTCQRLPSGHWSCTSDPNHHDRIYEIDGAVGLQACAVATGLASKDQLKVGKDSCAPVTESSGDGFCTTDLVCGPFIEVDFAPSVRARLARYGSVECAQQPSDTKIFCGFRFHDTTKGYDLSFTGSSFSCGPLLEFCLGTTAPDFADPRSCVVTDETSTVAGCDRSDICSHPEPTTELSTFPTVEARYASCEPADGGGASCYCSGQDSTFSFHVASAPDDTTCAAVITSCEPTAEIKVTGDVKCQQQAQTSNPDNCDADLSCQQPATVDGRDIVADGRMMVRCARQARGKPWVCSCASDQLTATFSLGTATGTSQQACGQAPQECLKHIPVHVGPSQGIVDPPDPVL